MVEMMQGQESNRIWLIRYLHNGLLSCRCELPLCTLTLLSKTSLCIAFNFHLSLCLMLHLSHNLHTTYFQVFIFHLTKGHRKYVHVHSVFLLWSNLNRGNFLTATCVVTYCSQWSSAAHTGPYCLHHSSSGLTFVKVKSRLCVSPQLTCQSAFP